MGILRKSVKKVIAILPFKRQFFSFLRDNFRISESVWRHLYFKGPFRVNINDQSAFSIMHYGFQLENEVFWRGLNNGWESHSIHLWTKLVSRSQTIIDIGANTGIYALVAKALNPGATVFAFEPVARVFEKLQANVQLNSFDIRCEPLAVSNQDGEAVFYDVSESEHIYSVTLNKNLNDPAVKVVETRTRTIRLDSYLEQYGIPAVDLLKIDVETHEPEVLEGFVRGLQTCQPTILIEVLSQDIGAKIENLVSGMGYLFFNIDENTGIRQTAHIGKSDYYNYLLCKQPVADYLQLRYS